MRKIILQNGERAERPCVATLGFFDGVHLGHQHLIRQVTEAARRDGLDATVITFDTHPRQALQEGFQPRLLTTFDERIIHLATTGADNCAVLHFDKALASLTAREFMEQVLRDQLGVRRLILGYDNRFGRDRSEGFDDYVRHGAALGIEVLQSDALVIDGLPVSSSAVRKALAEGDVRKASRLLGYRYIIVGTVVEGFQQGRRLGFPTANLDLPDDGKIVPAPGVYAVGARVEHSMEMKHAVMNIGHRPTFDGHTTTLETHIINYDANLYGERLVVTFAHRLRDERLFASPSELALQMKEDVRVAQELFEKDLKS
ncbi:MAG: riboflavin biosynthesis protein RibF [Prevotella sp.]|nr:riboflavin biosynthesis protein RibF [Prevotella sp.]